MLSSRVFWVLLLGALAISAWRVVSGQVDLRRIGQEEEFAFDLVVDVSGSAGNFNFEVFVPRSAGVLVVRDEEIGAGDLDLRVVDLPEGRRLVSEGTRNLLPTRIHYSAKLGLHPRVFKLPDRINWSDLATPAPGSLDSTRFVPTGDKELVAELARLFPEAVPPGGALPASWPARLSEVGIDVIEAVDRLHRRCQDGLASANFSGSTDALTALRLGEASCGGKSRLMVGLLRTLGIPSRLLGGLILGDSTRKRTSHVWVEVAMGNRWVPYDPLNNHRAELPSTYLPLYVGDLALIRHTRGLAFDYGFRAPAERVPRVWTLTPDDRSMLSGPSFLARNQFSLIILAPFALLLTVFIRQVVGFEAIGVFLPVLLGFCVAQIGWTLSGIMLAATLIFGVGVRLGLLKLNLLHVPRAALMITFLVMLFLALTVSLEALGIHTGKGVLVLPLAALAMAVEKFTMVAMERGATDALKLLVQTLVLATGAALILLQPIFKVLTVTFPEVLLIVLAEIIVIGQYRGLRWMERWRFRAVRHSS